VKLKKGRVEIHIKRNVYLNDISWGNGYEVKHVCVRY